MSRFSGGRFRQRVESIMGRDRPSGKDRMLAGGLGLAAASYGGAAALRPSLYRVGCLSTRRLTCAVIAVGNITVGGTGKTPLVMALARRLRDWGYRVAVVSRGYRGRAERSGGVVSDGRRLRMGPEAAGDEPFMMATALKDVPVVVGRDRYTAGRRAQRRFDSRVLILDDAFQHIQLHRDINLLVMDAHRPFGNGRLLPRGPLREPLSALWRADAYLLTGAAGPTASFDVPPPAWAHRLPPHRPVFRIGSRLQLFRPERAAAAEAPTLRPVAPDAVAGCRVVAFSGIARRHRFIAGLDHLGIRVAEDFAFPDHHDYTGEELARIVQAFRSRNAQAVVTTEKDWARMGRRFDCSVPVTVVGIRTRLGMDTEPLARFLQGRLHALGVGKEAP